MNESSGGHQTAWAICAFGAWIAISIALATMTASTGVGYSVLLLLLLAGSLALLAFFKRKALIRWPSIAVATIFVVVAVYVGLINDPSDSDEPTAFSATTSERPTTTTTTPPPMTTPTSTLPTPAGPPLPPEEQVINESKSAEFFDGALLLANQSTYSSYVALTITTDATSCTSYLDVGERAVIAANDAGNRFFRVTVLETDPDASARLRVEDLPQENWPARSLFCPT